MCYFLIQRLTGLGGTQRSGLRVPASDRIFYVLCKTEQDLKVPFEFFSFVRLFSRKFLNVSKGFNFLIFCNRMDVEKAQRIPLFLARQFRPPFGFFGYCGKEYLTQIS